MHNALCNSLKATGQVKRAVVDTQGEADFTEHTSGECTYLKAPHMFSSYDLSLIMSIWLVFD